MALYYFVSWFGKSWIDGDRIRTDPPIYDEISVWSWRPSECVWIVPGTIHLED
jgi:hypothetical protein